MKQLASFSAGAAADCGVPEDAELGLLLAASTALKYGCFEVNRLGYLRAVTR